MRNRCSLARRSSIPNCIASLIHFRTSGSCGAQPERSCVKSTIVGDKDSAIRDGFAENLKTQTFHHHKHLTPFNQEVTDSLTQDLEWIRRARARNRRAARARETEEPRAYGRCVVSFRRICQNRPWEARAGLPGTKN